MNTQAPSTNSDLKKKQARFPSIKASIEDGLSKKLKDSKVLIVSAKPIKRVKTYLERQEVALIRLVDTPFGKFNPESISFAPDYIFIVLDGRMDSVALTQKVKRFRSTYPFCAIIFLSYKLFFDELGSSRPQICDAAAALPITYDRLGRVLAAARGNLVSHLILNADTYPATAFKRILNERSSLRHYILATQQNPFPRENVLRDPFFDITIEELLSLNETQLRRKLGYVVGMGAVARKVFLEILTDLRAKSGM